MSALNYVVKKLFCIINLCQSKDRNGQETFQEIQYRSEKEKCCRIKARLVTMIFIDSAQDGLSEQFLMHISLQ